MEQFIFPLLIFGFISTYLVIAHTERMLFLTAFLIPFSIEFRDIIPSAVMSFSLPSELFLVLITIMVTLKWILDSRYPLAVAKHKISFVILFYLFWILITSITSTLPLVSFKFLIAKIWFIVPAYFFFAQIVKRNINNAFKLLLFYATGLAIVVMIVSCKHAMAGIRLSYYSIMGPYYNDHTAYGAILAFFTPILAIIPFVKTLPRWIRRYSIVLLVPVLMGLLLSFSRAAWLSVIFAAGVCMILLLKIKLRTIIFSFGVILALLLAFQTEIWLYLNRNTQDSSAGNFIEHFRSATNVTSDVSNIERLNRWQSAINMCHAKPLTGWGPGTYQFNYAAFQMSNYKTYITTNAGTVGKAHSEYFGPLADSGIVGLISVIILIAIVLFVGVRVYYRTHNPPIKLLSLMCVLALITYFIHGIVNEFLDTDKLAIPVFAAMAVITVCSIESRQELK
jgi:O-antigen ligase